MIELGFLLTFGSDRDGSIHEITDVLGPMKDALELSKSLDTHTSFEYD